MEIHATTAYFRVSSRAPFHAFSFSPAMHRGMDRENLQKEKPPFLHLPRISPSRAQPARSPAVYFRTRLSVQFQKSIARTAAAAATTAASRVYIALTVWFIVIVKSLSQGHFIPRYNKNARSCFLAHPRAAFYLTRNRIESPLTWWPRAPASLVRAYQSSKKAAVAFQWFFLIFPMDCPPHPHSALFVLPREC